ncbi:MAG: amidohydrolase family protein, partial [Enterobacterales bacterium]|nr:amidohydrolase family protein [Enterobacterales bacterium]
MKLKTIMLSAVLLFSTSFHADTLIHNIQGFTSTEEGLLEFSGLHIDDAGKVKSTLNTEAVNKILSGDTKGITVIDGNGKYMLPGLIDAHGHILGYGQALSNVDLTISKSAEHAAKLVAEYAAKHRDQEWILGRGWNQVLWDKNEFPNAETLDNAVPGKPVALNRVDGHAMWANTEAMKRAGITKDTLDPAGGEIIRDERGNPTGVLIDNAMDMVGRAMPKMTIEQHIYYINKAVDALKAEGITSVHDAGVSPMNVDAFKMIAEKEGLDLRVYAMLGVNTDGYAEAIEKGPEPSLYDDRLSVRSIKIQIDGALGSRGAALDEPYSDRPDTYGLLLHTPTDTENLTKHAMENGFQVNTHAIGDKGNRLLLDIFAKYPEHKNLRNRVEHAQIVHLKDIPRFAALDVIPSMQPTHATSDKNMAKDRVGEKRLAGAYAWRKFLKQGSRIASGSDFPVEPSNPFFGLHAAVTRQDRENQPLGGWRPEEKMTRAEALRSFTLDAAYSGHQEKVLGSLEAGKWADFILTDKDYFSVPEQDIWKIKVLETWQAGKK